jgi:alpha-D-xyloside xylohydrolase
VWDGIVPDFLTPEARRIFANYHEREHVALGVSGYKLDECDNSDFTRNWSFPEISRFPSGADGEQMHSLFGLRYQDTIQGIFEKRNQRTYGLVRSSHALAAPYPYVLYSDLYDHATSIRSVAHAGFSGLLWTPEVRARRCGRSMINILLATT